MTKPPAIARENACTQSQSTFFGLLPREIRDMIYAHLWEGPQSRQHVFQREGGGLTYYTCTRPHDSRDDRNREFEKFWNRYRNENPGSAVRDATWARRMSSTWNEHWCCEEVMLDKTKGGRQEEGSNSPRSAFLPCLLSCKQMYHEAGPSLYAHITLIVTTLTASHRLFVSNPPPQLIHLRSLELSLNVPYAALHNHQEHRERQQHTATLRPNAWADVCVALSDLSLLQRRGDGISEDGNNGHGGDDDATLRNVSLRLDLVEDDRFWWEVRESSALSAIRGPLRARLALQLPELTVDVDRIKMFQYESSPSSPSESPVPGQQNQGKAEDGQEVRGDIGTDNQPFLVYPLPSYLRTPPGGNAKKRLVPDFKSLKRYSRRRWTSTTTTEDRVNDGIESRLEFFTPVSTP